MNNFFKIITSERANYINLNFIEQISISNACDSKKRPTVSFYHNSGKISEYNMGQEDLQKLIQILEEKDIYIENNDDDENEDEDIK